MKAVEDAAEDLGVSTRRVRQMLERGDLPGQHIGRSWVIADSALRAYRDQVRVPGRRWAPSSAWLLLSEAEPESWHIHASRAQRSRARQHLARLGLAGLSPNLRTRAEIHRYFAHPAALERLMKHEGLILGGVSAAPFVGADLLGVTDELEAYVDKVRLAEIVDSFALIEGAERPNVVLRVVAHDLWPFPENAHIAPAAVVVADLLEHPDQRVRRAGEKLLG